MSFLHKDRIKILLNEYLPLLALTTLVLYAFHPFISGYNLGAGPGDAQLYQYQLHDALIQLKQGIFPVYIGQSEFSYFGFSFMRAPYYILLGQLLNILTFGHLNALYIQHLTVLTSILGAAFLSYYCFRRLAPMLPWVCFFLAFFYISCPGVAGLIYRSDMYFSLVSVPFIPLVFYGLIRMHQNNDMLSSLFVGAGLSAVWMSHPPISTLR